MSNLGYKKLTEEDELFHPKSQFIICKSLDGKYAICAIMPELHGALPTKKFKKVIKRIRNKYRPFEFFNDIEAKANLGSDQTGDVYTFDIHLVGDNYMDQSIVEGELERLLQK